MHIQAKVRSELELNRAAIIWKIISAFSCMTAGKLARLEIAKDKIFLHFSCRVAIGVGELFLPCVSWDRVCTVIRYAR
jgi:hypothetical protein